MAPLSRDRLLRESSTLPRQRWWRRLVAYARGALSSLAWSGANAPAQARAPYDGLWSVSLKVEQGSCGEHEIEVFIRNGEISHAGQWGFFTADER